MAHGSSRLRGSDYRPKIPIQARSGSPWKPPSSISSSFAKQKAPDVYSADWSYPTKIKFGAGRLAELGESCEALGLARPLLVTDRGLAATKIVERAKDALKAAGYGAEMFAEVEPDPTDHILEMGLAAFREGGHDGVVAIGGGSALDLGKTVAFMAHQTRPVWDFEDIGDWWTRANADVIRPVVAVPTTSGTGSEVSRATVITNSVTQTKKIIFHHKLMPSIAILDPMLTVGLPPVLTAGTGMDALTHNIEAFCGKYPHPLADGIALEGTRLARENLLRAYQDGSDIEARGNMMIASAMGAIAFQRGLGAVHALSHPIGTLYHTHHGMTNAVLMPHVFDWNRPEIEAKIERLTYHLRIGGGYDGFRQWLVDLAAAIKVPVSLTALGVRREDFRRIAEMSVLDPTAAANPRPFHVEGALEILEAAA
ncbi:MAG: iron-containing alcohol dehydrogenase [Rhizobiales bacterium]|nr:iron-containing alcohol dehydrogenase [Hyphomicrobiales bacterium]